MNNITEEHVPGEEVYQVVQALEPVISSVPRAHGILACLSIAAALQAPDASMESLQACVKGASQFMCLFLSTPENAEGATVPETRN